MRLALIAAVAENGIVGRGNKLPWHLPEDLKYFKRITLGKPVVMGRKTWDSIGRPLPGRTNIVISRQPNLELEGASVVADLPAALRLAESVGRTDGSEELMVIGGSEIYALALPIAQRLYLTEVHAEVAGDAAFPAWHRDEWEESSRQRHSASETNPYDYSFVIYNRR
jgi:dihydrofolate reductase